MKKIFYLICCVLTIFFCLTGCSSKKPAITDTSGLAGAWYGCGNALGKDSSFRADNLCLSIDNQGGFVLTDTEQSADLFHGTVSIDSKSNISITADPAYDNRLPKGWEELGSSGNIAYRAPDTEHLLLTYGDISYYFVKEGTSIQEKAATSVSPLLDIAETDIWYSSPDTPESTSVYELALYDKYAELYYIDTEAANRELCSPIFSTAETRETLSPFTHTVMIPPNCRRSLTDCRKASPRSKYDSLSPMKFSPWNMTGSLFLFTIT